METILEEICNVAVKHCNINKIVLFGSRARKDNSLRSDIDLAVWSDGDIFEFEEALENDVYTLLEFDITKMTDNLDVEFIHNVEKEGIVIYEKS